MFRVSFFVDDRKLGDALRALLGLAHGSPEVQPVTNVEKKPNGSLRARSGGTQHEQLLALLKERKQTTVTAADADEFLRSIGRESNKGGSNLVRRMTALGLLRVPKGQKRGKGNRFTYEVAL